MSGAIVVIEGLDGSGKTTQYELLIGRLTKKGIPARGISFPDYKEKSSTLIKMYLAGEFGESPDAVNAYAASMFYAADRYVSFKKHWQCDYEANKLIIAARYSTSNAIHQMVKLPENEWDAYLSWLDDFEYNKLELPRPDQVIFLDMPTAVSQELLLRRYDGDDSQKDVHERAVGYLEQCHRAAHFAADRLGWTVIPCAKGGIPFSIETIAQTIWDQMIRRNDI